VEALVWSGSRLFSSGLHGEITEWDLNKLNVKVRCPRLINLKVNCTPDILYYLKQLACYSRHVLILMVEQCGALLLIMNEH
jgi:hypothetical protein